MRILLTSLLLMVGLNLILARSIYWDGFNPYDDFDYGFDIISNRYDDNYQNMWKELEKSEESVEDSSNEPETLDEFIKSVQDLIDDLDKSEENTDKNDNDDDIKQTEDIETSDEIIKSVQDLIDVLDKSEENTDENDNDDDIKQNEDIETSDEIIKSIRGLIDDLDKSEEAIDSKANDDDNGDNNPKNIFTLFFNNPFVHIENEVSKSSEEKKDNDDIEEQEVSDEVTPETVDLTKSSEEKSDIDEISDKEIEELATLILTLSAIDDLIEISNKRPEFADENEDELIAKEVDEFLTLFSSILDNIIEEERKTYNSKEDNDDVTTPKNDSDEDNNDNDVTTPDTDSDEDNDDDNTTTTPEPDSDEENDNDYDVTTPQPDSDEENDNDYDVTTPKDDSDENNSNSNENEVETFSLTFHSIDDREENLNDHKYEIVDPSTIKAVKPTTSPLTSFTFDENNVIEEYVELRQNVDTEQDALVLNEHQLDKDFYNIISNNYNAENINKFEKDFFAVRENLDRIKRNINAMENLSSKLYLHKLVNDAVKNLR